MIKNWLVSIREKTLKSAWSEVVEEYCERIKDTVDELRSKDIQ